MLRRTAILACFVALPILAVAPTLSYAQDSEKKDFVKKRYTIKGSAHIEEVDGEVTLVFSNDFKTKNGPDLKIYLSKRPLSRLSAQNVDKSTVRLSVLKSHRGAQTYKIPKTIDLDDYKSVIIHCEAFSVLWGGFDL